MGFLSEDEALRALEGMLWERALEEHSAVLEEAGVEERARVMKEIGRGIAEVMRKERERWPERKDSLLIS